MNDIFRFAEQAKVPILIHAGRGMPPVANGLADLAWHHPDAVLILAHGAICDQGTVTTRLADHPGVLYDISCFFPVDVIELFGRVPAERIVFASDPPYGLPASTLYLALRVARQARLDDASTRLMLGGTMARLLEDGELPGATAPRRGEEIIFSGRLARVYGYSSLVGPALFAGALKQGRAMLDMALAACRDPEPGSVGQALDTVGGALSAARTLLESEEMPRGAFDLVYRSNALLATEILDRA
jgi:hypothetical protein